MLCGEVKIKRSRLRFYLLVSIFRCIFVPDAGGTANINNLKHSIMTNTIITINHDNYTENVIVTAANVQEVRNMVSGKDWSYVVEGETMIETPFSLDTNTNGWVDVMTTRVCDDFTSEMRVWVKDGKIALAENERFTFQKIKNGSFKLWGNTFIIE